MFILHLVTAHLTHPDHSHAKCHMAASGWKKWKLLWYTWPPWAESTVASLAYLEAGGAIPISRP